MATANNLVEKLQTLTPDQIHEVEEFIESLQMAGDASVSAHAALSEQTFQSIWNNPEDDVYDAA